MNKKHNVRYECICSLKRPYCDYSCYDEYDEYEEALEDQGFWEWENTEPFEKLSKPKKRNFREF